MSRDVLVEGNLIKQIGQGLKANRKSHRDRRRRAHIDARSNRWACPCHDQRGLWSD
jgi:hypothetical protein